MLQSSTEALFNVTNNLINIECKKCSIIQKKSQIFVFIKL